MIKVVEGDIWDFYANKWTVIVPTNGWVNRGNGMLAMGRGIAIQARKLFKNLEFVLGEKVTKYGNHCFYLERQNLISFPTKNDWKDPSEISLIEQSCKELKIFMQKFSSLKIAMPKVGCGNGKLQWSQVAPIIENYFGEYSHDRFLIVDNESGDTKEYRGKNENKERGDNSSIFA